MDQAILITTIIIAVAGIIGGLSRFIPGLKTDNIIEEKCEDIIKDKTGMTIDLSPDTPDPDIK